MAIRLLNVSSNQVRYEQRISSAVSAVHFIFILFAVRTIFEISAGLKSNKAQLVQHHDEEIHT